MANFTALFPTVPQWGEKNLEGTLEARRRKAYRLAHSGVLCVIREPGDAMRVDVEKTIERMSRRSKPVRARA